MTHLKRLSLVFVLATLVACRSASTSTRNCQLPDQLRRDFVNVRQHGDLIEGISLVLTAHCSCSFPPDARLRVPLGVDGKGSWEGAEKRCLGPAWIAEWRVESYDFVELDLVPRGKPATRLNLYVVFGHLFEGKWEFSWPVGTGPPLHPK